MSEPATSVAPALQTLQARAGWRRAAPLLVLALASLAPYAGTWNHDFVDYDDASAIANLPLIRRLDIESLPNFFRPDVYAGLPEYMPLKNLSYALDYAVFGLSARGFRVQQQLWYVAAVLLTFVWLRALLTRMAQQATIGLDAAMARTVAFVTAALFAVHPVHVESVTWLSGRKDVLSGTFMAAALLSGLAWSPRAEARSRWRLAATLTLTGLALLSKPMAVVLPLLFLVQDLASTARPLRLGALLRARGALYAGSVLVCGAFALGYHALTALHAAKNGGPEWEYPGPPWLRWGQQFGAYAWLAWMPVKLVPLYPPDLFDPSVASWRAALGLAWLGALAVAAAWSVRREPAVLVCVGLFVVPLLPVVLRPVWGQYLAGRYLFHAVLGAILALTWGAAVLVRARPRLRTPIVAAGAVLALTWTLGTVDYNRAWRDSTSLWRHALRVYPRFTRFHELGAGAALRTGQVDDALALLGRCVELAPRNAHCAGMLGGLLLGPDPSAGEALLRRALADDQHGIAHLRLAQHLARTGRAGEAVSLYERFLHGRTPATGQIAALAELTIAAGEFDKALGVAREAVRASAANHAASPPPVDVVLHVARARGDRVLEERVQAAAAACTRSDCFRERLAW